MNGSHNDGYTFDFPNARTLVSDQGWWKIYESLFPADHRETRSTIQRSLRHGTGVVMRMQHNHKTVSIASGHMLKDPAAIFLVYLGVDPAHRHHSLGARMMDALYEEGKMRLMKQGRHSCGMIWEVEDPQLAHHAQEKEHREKLIAYFMRHGGHMLNSRYIQPPVDGIHHVAKKLMFRPQGGQSVPQHTAIQALVHAMYFEKYGAENQIAPAKLNQLLAA
jgi:GNAT superfamily N-acetyltransferase